MTRAVSELVSDRGNWKGSRRVVPLTLVRDEIEFPGYMLESEEAKLLELGGTHAGGRVYRFDDDESMETAIGLLTATCVECLRELRAGQEEGVEARRFRGGAITQLNFGRIDRCSVRLNTATLLGLKSAYEEFANTGQDLRNFEICIEDESEARVDPTPEDHVISVTFAVKMPPGMRGLGNASPLGTSIQYVISPETGEILRVYLTK